MPQPLDLDPVQARYADVERYQTRDDALASANDVPDLIAEIQCLRAEVDAPRVGWMAAIDALEAEAKAWQRLGDTARWSMLEVAAATLRRLLDERPKAPEVGQGTYTREVHDLGDIVLTYEAWEPSP